MALAARSTSGVSKSSPSELALDFSDFVNKGAERSAASRRYSSIISSLALTLLLTPLRAVDATLVAADRAAADPADPPPGMCQTAAPAASPAARVKRPLPPVFF